MLRNILYYGLIGAVALAGVVVAVDALSVTDEERIEEFVEAVTGEVRGSRIDHALRYTNLAAEPVEVVVGDEPRRYEAGEEGDLSDEAHQVLAPLEGAEARLLQDAVVIEGDRARVALRVSTDEGVCDVQYLMRKHGDDWLVTRVRVL